MERRPVDAVELAGGIAGSAGGERAAGAGDGGGWCWGNRCDRGDRSRGSGRGDIRAGAGAGAVGAGDGGSGSRGRRGSRWRGSGGVGRAVEEGIDNWESADSGLSAASVSLGPTNQAVGDISGIAVSSNAEAKVAGGVDRAGVIGTGSDIELATIASTGRSEELHKTGACGGTIGTVCDHLGDLVRRARVLDTAVGDVVAGSCTIVILHQARVTDTEVSGRHADTAVTLLHDDSEDVTRVDTGGSADRGDGRLQASNLIGRVVSDVEGIATSCENGVLVIEPRRRLDL